MAIEFTKAERTQAKLKIGLTGPSGAGKTLSALRLSKGLVPGGRVAVVDTENGSASLYAGKQYAFDTLKIGPPYTTEKYIEAIHAAVKAGYDVLIIDSISHAWSGEGGLLQQKEQIDQRGGNSYTNWAKVTPKHERFLSNILHSPIHIIATMRSKQDYVLTDKNGKQVPMKVGLAPVQREGMEYEFTVVLDIAMNHQAEASKDRTGLFNDRIFLITEEIGDELRQWMESGAPMLAPAVAPPPEPTAPQAPAQAGTGAASVEPPWPGFDPEESFDAEPPPPADVSQDPGEYEVAFGRKYKGKKLKDIPVKELMSYLEWLEADAHKKGTPLSGDALAYKENLARYLVHRENQKPEQEDLPDANVSDAQAPADPAPPPRPPMNRAAIVGLVKRRKWTNEHVQQFMKLTWGVDSSNKLNDTQFGELMNAIEGFTPGEAIRLAQDAKNAQEAPQ